MSTDQHNLEMALLAQRETQREAGPTASPSVPYIKYIMEDSYEPKELPVSLRAVAYDKEMALSNLTIEEIRFVRFQLQRAEIDFTNGRPALSSNYKERMMLDTLPAKQLLKLCRSRDGGFERKQQTTQTVVRLAQAGVPAPTKGRRRWIFGKRKEEAVKT